MMILLRHGALVLIVAAVAACTVPPRPPADEAGDAATVRGWVTTGFQ